jgi:hypothetical protein
VVAVEKEDGSRRAAVRPPMSGRAAPNDRACAVPMVEVVSAVSAGTVSRGEAAVVAVAREHAAVVERKAGRRHGGAQSRRCASFF